MHVGDVEDLEGHVDHAGSRSRFLGPEEGVRKVSPRTSIPCSRISWTETMLSRPPEKRDMALTGLFVSVEDICFQPFAFCSF